MGNEDYNCNLCNIAGVIHVTKNICDEFELDCKEIEKAINEDKKPQEFIDVIKDIKEKNEGVAEEQFNEVLKIIEEEVEIPEDDNKENTLNEG